MAVTFSCPNTCGFGRIVALEVSREAVRQKERGESSVLYRSHCLQEQYKLFKNQFASVEETFQIINYQQFIKKLPSLKDVINKWNFRKIDEKRRYLNEFSRTNWAKLSDARKKEHSFPNCKGCALRYAETQSLFPVKSTILKQKALQNPVVMANMLADKLRTKNGRVVKPSKKEKSNTAKAMYKKMATVYEKDFGSFAEAISTIGVNLHYETKNDRRRTRRGHFRQSKENTEKQLAETAFLR